MKPIDRNKAPMRCLVRYTRDPGIDDVFYELIDYLDRIGKDTFTESEYASKMRLRTGRCRDHKTEEIGDFIARGWVEREGKSKKYKVVNHPWS